MKKEKMLLPRLAVFKSNPGKRVSLKHIVMVDGDVWRPICIRNPVNRGTLVANDSEITCSGCRNKGWTKSLGRLGTGQVDANGRYLSRT